MAKIEVANVFRCYLPNLLRFWIVRLSFVTLWPVTILQRIFYLTLYREVPKLVLLFFTQDKDEDCLRLFCGMGNPSEFTLWYDKLF